MQETTPPPLQTPSPTSLLQMFKEMQTSLLGVEMLWTRLKQLEIRQENTETQMVRLNARISAAIRRRYADTGEDDPESQQEDLPVTTVEAAESESKRQHLVPKYSHQQPAPPTTT